MLGALVLTGVMVVGMYFLFTHNLVIHWTVDSDKVDVYFVKKPFGTVGPMMATPPYRNVYIDEKN